ncbi:MAG: DUF933 domain-containing protein [candidate division WOR-3 bacterium]|jgi:hypothetical protein
MKCAIFGLNRVGKSTLFRILTNSSSKEGILLLYDRRLDELAKIFNPKKITHAFIEISEINNFDDKLLTYDLLILVVKNLEDFNELKFKMLFFDLKIVEKRIENAKKTGNNKIVEVFSRLKEHLEGENFLSSITLDQSSLILIRDVNFITKKPMIFVYNVFEGEEIDNSLLKELKKFDYLVSNLKLEEEAKNLSDSEREEFLKLYGFEPIYENLIKLIRDKLGIILFFTAGEKEVRSWILRKGQTAKDAAGRIHSDLEKGFVRAEIISYDEFMEIKNFKLAKEKGLVRIEGKDYIVKDGDIIYIRSSI